MKDSKKTKGPKK